MHRLPKKQNKKKRRKKCSVSEFTDISGMVELNDTPWNLLYPLKMIPISYASMPEHEPSYGLFFPPFFDSQNMNVHLVQVNYQ